MEHNIIIVEVVDTVPLRLRLTREFVAPAVIVRIAACKYTMLTVW